MIVTIGQPGLFPWWGTFAKAAVSDFFIHLDHVSWQKGGYLNRFLLTNGSRREWCTVPIRGAHVGDPIHSVRLETGLDLVTRHMDKVHQTLGTCQGDRSRPHSLVSQAYGVASDLAVDVATMSTELVAEQTGLNCRFRRSSELEPAGQSTSMLVGLIKSVGGDAYLFGPGRDGRCQRYLDVELMKRAGIRVGLATYGGRARASVIQDLWLGRSLASSTFPMAVEWL